MLPRAGRDDRDNRVAFGRRSSPWLLSLDRKVISAHTHVWREQAEKTWLPGAMRHRRCFLLLLSAPQRSPTIFVTRVASW
jgi:hypothetical protein